MLQPVADEIYVCNLYLPHFSSLKFYAPIYFSSIFFVIFRFKVPIQLHVSSGCPIGIKFHSKLFRIFCNILAAYMFITIPSNNGHNITGFCRINMSNINNKLIMQIRPIMGTFLPRRSIRI